MSQSAYELSEVQNTASKGPAMESNQLVDQRADAARYLVNGHLKLGKSFDCGRGCVDNRHLKENDNASAESVSGAYSPLSCRTQHTAQNLTCVAGYNSKTVQTTTQITHIHTDTRTTRTPSDELTWSSFR